MWGVRFWVLLVVTSQLRVGCEGCGQPFVATGSDAGVDSGVDSGVDAGVDSGVDAGSDAGTDAGSVTDGGVNLEVPIDLLDLGAASSGGATVTFERSRTSLDPTAYDGSVTYVFEIVAANLDPVNRSVSLVDAAGVSVASLVVPGSASASVAYPTLQRTPWSPTASPDYRLRLEQTQGNQNLRVFTARIIVQQVAATRTRLYYPVAVAGFFDSYADDNGTLDVDSYPTFGGDTFGGWTLDRTRFATLPAGTPWTFEVIGMTLTANTARYALFDNTTGTQVAGSTTATSSKTPQLMTASFASTAPGLVDGDVYGVRMQSPDGGTIALCKAGVWVSLAPLTRGEVFYRTGAYASGIAADLIMREWRVWLDLSRFSNATVQFQARGGYYAGPGPVSADIELVDDGPADFSPLLDAQTMAAGESRVPSSALALPADGLRTPALSPASGHRFYGRVAIDAGSAQVATQGSMVVVSFH
jgi:hypothetical protein